MGKRKIATKKCLRCEKEKVSTKEFYLSNSSNHKDGRYPICKTCLRNNLKITDDTDPYDEKFLGNLQNVLLEMNRPFIFSLWNTSVQESNRTGKSLFGIYMKNLMLNFQTLTWKESEFGDEYVAKDGKGDRDVTSKTSYPVQKVETSEDKNREDVLNMLGYDPFEFENEEDKRHLYNKLVDFLDDSTLEDSFKLPAVIEIVKSFNQIDKINIALSRIINKIDSGNAGGVKSLIDSKEKMLKSILALAKDNGISINHNNNKSKGSGTLSGIIKNLQERGFEEAEINLFDIETSEGMRQVADLSNQSIMNQLQFDENDYTSMLMEQREMIQEFDNKIMKLEEENRKLKKELLKYKNENGDIDER